MLAGQRGRWLSVNMAGGAGRTGRQEATGPPLTRELRRPRLSDGEGLAEVGSTGQTSCDGGSMDGAGVA